MNCTSCQENVEDEFNTDQVALKEETEWEEEETGLTQAEPEITRDQSTIPVSEIIQYLNDRTNSKFLEGNKKTKDLIGARWREGYCLDDFKRVIDIKTTEWLEEPQFCRYLRPETLFGPKLESYLNQKSKKKTNREEDFDLND